MGEYNACFLLDEEQEKKLAEVTALYNSVTGNETTPERFFSTMVMMGSKSLIDDLLSFNANYLQAQKERGEK